MHTLLACRSVEALGAFFDILGLGQNAKKVPWVDIHASPNDVELRGAKTEPTSQALRQRVFSVFQAGGDFREENVVFLKVRIPFRHLPL